MAMRLLALALTSWLLIACGGGGDSSSAPAPSGPIATAVRLPADVISLTAFYQTSKLVDIDKDGDLDLLLAKGHNVRLLLNDGRGYFTDAPANTMPVTSGQAGWSATDMIAADVNNDGYLDIILALFDDPTKVATSTSNAGKPLMMLINNKNGTFSDHSNWINGVGGPEALHMGFITMLDYTGDGKTDFITSAGIFANTGSGVFTRIPTPHLFNAVGDFNGDGKPDLVANGTAGWVTILMNNSSGPNNYGSTSVQTTTVVRYAMAATAALKLGTDAYADLFIAEMEPAGFKAYPTQVVNFSAAGFQSPLQQNVNVHYVLAAPVVADFNKDGRPDIFLADEGFDGGNFEGAQNRILIQNASGALVDETVARLPIQSDYTIGVTYGDIDGDGDIDMFVINSGSSKYAPYRSSLLLNDGTGHFTVAY